MNVLIKSLLILLTSFFFSYAINWTIYLPHREYLYKHRHLEQILNPTLWGSRFTTENYSNKYVLLPRYNYRRFRKCTSADLTLPLKPFSSPKKKSMDSNDSLRPYSNPYHKGKGCYSGEMLERLSNSFFSARLKYNLKTVRGLMIDGPRECDEIDRVVSSNLSSMRYAYNKALQHHPGLVGEIGFLLQVVPSGKVADCRIIEATMNDTALQETFVNIIRHWEFDWRPDISDTVKVAFVFWCGS